jgi:hypothetical protein
VTPLFPSEAGYCTDEQQIGYGGKQFIARARSSLLGWLAPGRSDSCDSFGVPSYGQEHSAELSLCISSRGQAFHPAVVRGPGELYVTCPSDQDPRDSDYIRLGISCTGQRWAGARGRAECLALFRSIVSSLQQQAI